MVYKLNEKINSGQEEFLKKLLDAISAYESYSDFEQLYQFINQITSEAWNIGESFVLSVPHKKYSVSMFRMLWNREIGQKWAEGLEDFNDIEKIFDEVSKKFEEGDNFIEFEGILISKIGSDGGQEFFSCYPSSKNVDTELFSRLTNFTRRSFKVVKQWKEMSKLSTLIYTDDVTGLFNQRKLLMDLDECIRKFESYKESFSVLFLDLDHFKLVNDDHGHMVGTSVLIQVAETLKDAVRDTDLLYRYGGDEFVIILQNADIDISKVVGNRILDFFKKRVFKLSNDVEQKLSASIGVATFPTHANSKDAILSLADQMMYEAKKEGRGQVKLAKDLFKIKKV